jgi:LEA14-like dessication related protein
MKKIVVWCSFLLLLSACTGGLKDVRIEDFKVNDVKLSSARLLIDASIKVHNPTGRDIHLKELELDVLNNRQPFAHLSLQKAVTIPARSDEYHSLPLVLNVSDMLALLTGGIDIHNPKLEQFAVNGHLKLKTGALSKKIKVQEQTLEQLLKGW